jgi:hypothetical protein
MRITRLPDKYFEMLPQLVMYSQSAETIGAGEFSRLYSTNLSVVLRITATQDTYFGVGQYDLIDDSYCNTFIKQGHSEHITVKYNSLLKVKTGELITTPTMVW